jgi:hypothetical protein
MATTNPAVVTAAHREAYIDRLEKAGALDPHCAGCRPIYDWIYAEWTPGASLPMGPRHTASKRCESGKREHCTCDACF